MPRTYGPGDVVRLSDLDRSAARYGPYTNMFARAAGRLAYKAGASLYRSASNKAKSWLARQRMRRQAHFNKGRAVPGKFNVSKKMMFRSPGFFKRNGLKKSRRFSGAQSSKSSGFIKRGSSRLAPLDKFSRTGVITHRETGGILATSAAEKAQSMMLIHSTFGKYQTKCDISTSFIKMIAKKLGRVILNFQDLILAPVVENNIDVRYYFKQYVDGPENNFLVTITGTTTWQALADNFVTFLDAQFENQTNFYLTRCLAQYAVTGIKAFEVDLSKAKIEYYSKSSMKIQNRTINSTGNVEEDDVDNVPLYGKTYDGKGNWLKQQFVYYGTNATVKTNYNTYKFVSTSAMAEPLNKKQLQHCSAVGKIHLDPGQIKTSVLVSRGKKSLNGLLNAIRIAGNESTLSTVEPLSIGKYRAFHLEKMIQSVATTDVNAPTIAWEVDIKTGYTITCPSVNVSNYINELSPL